MNNSNNELLQKLHQINLDKQENLLPENIRKGVTALGVTGTLEEVHILNQDKTVEPKVTSQDVTPDEGFTGLGKVTVEGVTNDIDSNIRPENIRKDVSILGVVGTLEQSSGGDVMLFASVEEMNATTGNEEDLAIVYADSTANFTAETEAQVVKFPNTVVLPTAFTGSVYTMFRAVNDSWFDAQVDLRQTRFSFDGYGDDGEYRIQYTSTDGITYTRTDGGSEEIDFGVPITCNYVEEWAEPIGYFMQIGSTVFEGLYTYTSEGWELAPTGLTATENYVLEKKYYGADGIKTGTLGSAVITNKTEAQDNAMLFNALQVLTISDTNVGSYFSGYKGEYVPDLNFTGSPAEAERLFENATNLKKAPVMDTSTFTSITWLFYGCKELLETPDYDLSSANEWTLIFQGCDKLQRIPNLKGKPTHLSSFAYMCYAITDFPVLDTAKTTSFDSMCASCTSLVNVPVLDTTSMKRAANMFSNCPMLSNESLNNILLMLSRATNFTATNYLGDNIKTLKHIGLSKEQVTICQGLSNWSAASAAGWITGY